MLTVEGFVVVVVGMTFCGFPNGETLLTNKFWSYTGSKMTQLYTTDYFITLKED